MSWKVALRSISIDVMFQLLWLKSEQSLSDLDMAVKRSLHFEHPDIPACLEALNQLSGIAFAPLMLKKQPDIVTTIRKLRKYVGPQSVADPKQGEEWTIGAQKIRMKANQVRKVERSCSIIINLVYILLLY